MSVYCFTVKEFEPLLEKFLQDLGGEVRAEVVAKAWNKIAKRNYWKDKLKYKEVEE